MNMKMSSIIGVVVCLCLLLGSSMAALPVSRVPVESVIAQPSAEPTLELKPVQSEVLQARTLVPEFANLVIADDEIIVANDFLKNKGFVAQTKENNFWGVRETYKSKPKGGIEIEETYSLQVRDYANPNSKDAAAVGRITVTASGRSEVYSFALIAPEGNFSRAEEYKVGEIAGKLQVAKANSWWSCLKQRLKDKCLSPCVTSLVSCGGSGSWAAYLACVAKECGGCFAKQAACCACNCKWWCKWATGCCHS